MSDKKRELIINYVPGEDCRVAVVENGRIEEFFSERADNVSHVGNIYVGKVTNVEPAIQAAFVEFGLESAGFLHASDVHPRYFPDAGEDASERIGKKIPRRDRPPIQDCLKRGDEVIVQVLKEGVGTKGPTLTSYLSIPGRFLVMMPGMDKVGVSRKVDDEETRAKMKAVLDQLELPEGFGFIVRTAGLDRTKAELKRDLAYLVRLQKDMEKRRKQGAKPRLLYSEGDLLFRSLRDLLTSDTERVVIDSEIGIKRGARFMKIVSPRSTTMLAHYKGRTPIFHALGLQEQIKTIYSREVPLPSGGRLVIDEAEALVAIDVNSGRHRDASDSETNALKTNLEAVEEIARQLRLRDMGGIVVNDLIDMRAFKHRREVEGKLADLMKLDRAKSTLAPISEFGLLEMTRQRMRGSHESQHFHDCPMCRGRGLIQNADSVAADALRDAAAVLDHDKVARVELAVHPRVASEFLSSKRVQLVRLEREMGKPVAVRLSESVPQDRVTIYAYDQSGGDIDIDRLPKFRINSENLTQYEDPDAASVDDGEDDVPILPDVLDDDRSRRLADELLGQEIVGEAGDASSGENFQLDAPGGRRGRRSRAKRGRGKDVAADGPPSVDRSPFNQNVRPAHVEPAKISGPRMIIEQPPETEPSGDHGQMEFSPAASQDGEGPNLAQPFMDPDGRPIAPEPSINGFLPPDSPLRSGGHAGGGGAGQGDSERGGRRRRRGRGRGRGGADERGPAERSAGTRDGRASGPGMPGQGGPGMQHSAHADGGGGAEFDDRDEWGDALQAPVQHGRGPGGFPIGQPVGGPVGGPSGAPGAGSPTDSFDGPVDESDGPLDSADGPSDAGGSDTDSSGRRRRRRGGRGRRGRGGREDGPAGDRPEQGSQSREGGQAPAGPQRSARDGALGGVADGPGDGENRPERTERSTGESSGRGRGRGGRGGRGGRSEAGGRDGGGRSGGARSGAGSGNGRGSSGGGSGGGAGGGAGGGTGSAPASAGAPAPSAAPSPKPRTLYGGAYKRLKPGSTAGIKRED